MSEDNHVINFEIYAVTDGEIVPIDQVDDIIFAKRMIGDGFAIRPTGNTVYSPIDGTVEQIASTKHAIYLSFSDDIKLLIHVGLDTIGLNGKGFETKFTKGMPVSIGDTLIQFDLEYIQNEGYDPVIAVVLLNGTGKDFDIDVHPTREAKALETLAISVKTKEIS